MPETPFETPSIDSIAALLPAFEFDSLIAQGGMGAVYRARQISLDRDVAVKILPRELCNDPAFRASFQAEAKAMARLIHPNLIGVFDSGEVGGLLYIVMEMVPGKSLFHSAYRQAIDPRQAAEIVIGICKGLAHAHENGIIHRDIKPANILLTPKREPKIGDFGLARTTGPDSQGLVMGTPGYTAPEVITHPDQTDKSSDIFSIGVLLRELLTGVTPESGDTGVPISDPALVQICNKATHPDPAMRFPDALSMAQTLERWMESCTNADRAAQYTPPVSQFAPTPPKGRPLLKSSIIVLSLLGVSCILWVITQKDKDIPAEQSAAASSASTMDSDKGASKGLPILEKPNESETNDTAPNESTDYGARIDSLNDLRHLVSEGKRDEMPEGTISVGDRMYFFVPSPMNWIQAHRFAGQYGAHLPLIEDEADLEWLKSQFPDDVNFAETWIGARAFENSWQAVDGSVWKRTPPQGEGTFAALTRNGLVVARGNKDTCPFFIQWHRHGKNPADINQMLKRTAATIDSPDPVFPMGTIEAGDARRLITWRQLNHDKASELAESSGGRLMEPNTPEHADWLEERLGNNGSKNGFWLGGRLRSGNWEWLSGAPWTFDRWSDGCPTEGAEGLRFVPSKGWVNFDVTENAQGLVIEWVPLETPVEAIKPPPSSAETEDSTENTKNVNPAAKDALTARAEELLSQHDKKRKAALKGNAEAYNLKLSAWLENPDADLDAAKRKLCVDTLKAHADSNRIPEGIPTKPFASFSEEVLDIAHFYTSKQQEIDSSFLANASTIRKFYVKNLESAAFEALKKNQKDAARSYTEKIKAASNTESWVATFDGLSSDNPKFPAFLIVSADFGINNKFVDVTEQFTKLFFSGEEQIVVDYITLKADPVPGVQKLLKIEYLANGVLNNSEMTAGTKIQPAAYLEKIGLSPDDVRRTLDPKAIAP